MRALLVLLIASCLAACSSTQRTPATDGPYFTQGFSDGCRTAEARRAAFDNRSYRSDELFATQESYRAGWRQGFRECQPQGMQPVQPTPEGAAVPIL